MHRKALLLCIALVVPCVAQQPRVPDLDAQRAAMKKLEFLVGKWLVRLACCADRESP